MKLLTKSLAVLVLSFVTAFAFTTLTTGVATAHEGEDHSHEDVAQADGEEAPAEEEQVTGEYTFTAQSGDSYSLIARKSIQIYGIETGTSISEAEIIAAETWLTQDAGSPELNVGQDVTISKSDVGAAVSRAQEMSDAVEALWAPYAAQADFNTDSVGEA